jgi:hypothetical protein
MGVAQGYGQGISGIGLRQAGKLQDGANHMLYLRLVR